MGSKSFITIVCNFAVNMNLSKKYKQHKTDFEAIPQQRPISLPCRVTGCPCRAYLYVPLNGAQPVRCRCKHFADQHSAAPGFTCNACSKCSGFHSCFTCACGQPAYAHDTVVETKQERLAQGKPVGRDVPYAAMGGLTGFSSLAEGYIRLDDSGIGTSSQVSSLSKPEEDDMAFFERRYQERSINRNKDIMKISCSLSEVCPHANSVFGTLDPKKCLVRYIDYGNTEILKRSDIVEIPLDLQFSSVAKNLVFKMSEFVFDRENLAVGDFNLGSNVSLAKIKQDQKLIEENEKLKTEKEVLLERYTALELKVEQTAQELQDLSTSLEAVYGQAKGTDSEEILKKFYDWKCNKREEFTNVRSETEVSLQHLTAWFQSTLKSDDHDESEIEKIKQEVTQLRSSVFQEIYHEQEEYSDPMAYLMVPYYPMANLSAVQASMPLTSEDDNVRSLLCSLIYCRSSVTAEQVVSAECFVLPKETSSPNSEEDTEYSQKKEEEELKVESSD
ncbi:hypothetical protein CB1_000406004 [Camelus ferus]|nr:hypothetical protein CB1_000406004 [Camelus ferus]